MRRPNIGARQLLLGLAAALQLAGTARASEPHRFAAVRDYIRAEMAAEHIPSVSVAVSRGGGVIWEESFGWADKEARVPATPHTPYRLASISKPLTAAALMTLVHSRAVDLDRPANSYLGATKLVAYEGDASGATLRRLANHTSGLSTYGTFHWLAEPGEQADAATAISHYGFLIHPPGERFVYSNLGYGVLGEIVGRVSGRGLPAYAEAAVFVPLGMSEASFDPRGRSGTTPAAGYDASGARIADFVVDYPGGAGAVASAHDLIRFAMFELTDHLADQAPILTDAEIEETHRPANDAPPGARTTGIGWALDPTRGLVQHSGYMPGVSTLLRLVPADDVAIVVLTNSSHGDRQPVEYGIADHILSAIDSGRGALGGPATTDPAPAAQAAFEAPAELVGRWRGRVRTYSRDRPVVLEFLPRGPFVRVRFTGEPLTAIADPRLGRDEINSRLTLDGEVYADLATPDVDRIRPYIVRLHLELHDGRLTGVARPYAYKAPFRGYAPHWVELERVP